MVTQYENGYDDNYLEWINIAKRDLRSYIDYKLYKISNSDYLIYELENVFSCLEDDNLGKLLRDGKYSISKNNNYIIIEYPVYINSTNRIETNYLIANANYTKFVFVNSIDSAPEVDVYTIKDIVNREKIIAKIDLKWDLSLIDYNLEYLRGRKNSIIELGGFADYPEDVDGNFEAFNYCLAHEYKAAMLDENFEALGSIDNDLLKKIAYWLNYDEKIGNGDIEFIKSIANGNFITSYGRTFLDAIITRNLGDIALVYVLNGVVNPKLYITAALYNTSNNFDVFNYIQMFLNTDEEYSNFINDVIKYFSDLYNQADEFDKDELINLIEPSFVNLSCFESIKNYSKYTSLKWVNKIIVNQTGKTRTRSSY